MTLGRRHALAAALAAALVADATPGTAIANGVTRREILGRVLSVDAAAGRLVVVREFRGRSTRVTLTAAPAIRVFTCGGGRPGLRDVKAGMLVSAFYEEVGRDGIANLVVIEPPR